MAARRARHQHRPRPYCPYCAATMGRCCMSRPACRTKQNSNLHRGKFMLVPNHPINSNCHMCCKDEEPSRYDAALVYAVKGSLVARALPAPHSSCAGWVARWCFSMSWSRLRSQLMYAAGAGFQGYDARRLICAGQPPKRRRADSGTPAANRDQAAVPAPERGLARRSSPDRWPICVDNPDVQARTGASRAPPRARLRGLLQLLL